MLFCPLLKNRQHTYTDLHIPHNTFTNTTQTTHLHTHTNHTYLYTHTQHTYILTYTRHIDTTPHTQTTHLHTLTHTTLAYTMCVYTSNMCLHQFVCIPLFCVPFCVLWVGPKVVQFVIDSVELLPESARNGPHEVDSFIRPHPAQLMSVSLKVPHRLN